jgi:NAD(P)-dependent dehydrogenase (short-subunit alcohol dehydrogenase family)
MTQAHNDPYASRSLDRTTDVSAFRLDGRVAVVIGGTGVLCGNIAETLALAGATAVLVGRDQSKADAILTRMHTDGSRGSFEQCDTTSRAQLRSLVERVLAQHGQIDILINGAGVNAATPFLDVPDEELDRIVTTNQLAVFRACQEFGRYFVERATSTGTGASVINIGSASGLTPLSRVFTYSMTKAAVHNLTKNLAREWGPLGVRCNVLVPGFFPAEQNRKILSADRVASILGHTPMGRFGEIDELGGAALLLASDAGRFITGTELVVDGGFSAMTI